MTVAKIFRHGGSQAVQLTREIHFRSSEVEILRRCDEVILREWPENLTTAFEALAGLSEDFFKGGRRQSARQKPVL